MMKPIFMRVAAVAALAAAAASVSAQDTYEEYVRNYISGLTKFKNDRDSAFTAMLRQRWEEFDAPKSAPARRDPEPPEPYTVPDGQDRPVDRPLPTVPEPKAPVQPNVDRQPAAPDKSTPAPAPTPAPTPAPAETRSAGSGNVSVDFYGMTVRLRIGSDMKFRLRQLDEDAIASAVERLCAADYPTTIGSLKDIRRQLRLNDYSYMLLVNKLADKFFGSGSDEAKLFTMFAMVQSGLNVKVAQTSGKLILLYAARPQLYDINFVRMDDGTYFLFDTPTQSDLRLMTYRGSFSGSLQPLSFSFAELPLLPGGHATPASRSYGGLTLTTRMNEGVMRLWDDLPQTDYSVYRNAAVSDAMRRDILTPLREHIAGMDELQAANFLLAFVQHGFDYKTDGEQFGRERPLFPDENFYYPFNDCEDRALIYTLWIRELLGLDTVILEYPNHAASAVAFKGPVTGDYVMHNGKKYTVCDPTCINAPVGVTMPMFRTTAPTVKAYDTDN